MKGGSLHLSPDDNFISMCFICLLAKSCNFVFPVSQGGAEA